jgi:hypothetical protein
MPFYNKIKINFFSSQLSIKTQPNYGQNPRKITRLTERSVLKRKGKKQACPRPAFA